MGLSPQKSADPRHSAFSADLFFIESTSWPLLGGVGTCKSEQKWYCRARLRSIGVPKVGQHFVNMWPTIDQNLEKKTESADAFVAEAFWGH